jgi:cell division septum initiation protein DivIVA
MSIELHAGGAADELDVDRAGRVRPNVSGDLPGVLSAGPMFRRVVAGYDRFQVDSYVRWAEDELVACDREREHLLARHLQTQAALAEARELLAHSPVGGRLLEASRRVGTLLAGAADEAENIRAEAENHRAVARAQAEVVTADARRVLADARTEAQELLAEADTEVAGRIAEADRVVAEAEQAGRDVRTQAAAHLAEAQAVEARALEQAAHIREQAVEEALAARRQARDEVVRMLGTGREERRRADAEAAATRERLDREAAARRALLLAEVAELESRRAELMAEPDTGPDLPVPSTGTLHPGARAYLDRIHERLGSHATPGRSSPRVAARNGGRNAA